MKTVFIIVCLFLLGCQKDEKEVRPKSPIEGSYQMVRYVIDDDTLVDATRNIDKWSFRDLTVDITRGTTDSTYSFSYSCYHKETGDRSSVTNPESTVKSDDSKFLIINYFNTMDINGGYIENDTLYSHSVGMNEKTFEPLITIIVATKKGQ